MAFPFGFGLGYTTFSYSELVADAEGVEVTVTNTGDRDGSDVAQLYVSRLGASGVTRPVRELKGYAKVRLAAGESRRLRIPFGPRTFRYFDAAANAWQVEAGEYEVAVGSHVRDLPVRATITREGATVSASVDLPAALPTTRVDDSTFAAMLGRRAPGCRLGHGSARRERSDGPTRDREEPAGPRRLPPPRQPSPQGGGRGKTRPEHPVPAERAVPGHLEDERGTGDAPSHRRRPHAGERADDPRVGARDRGLLRRRRDEKATKKAFDAAATKRSI